MAFAKLSGQPASGRQVQQLAALIVAAGHADFRDARGPLGLTQRQAGGKFTSEEADAFIAQLETEADLVEGEVATRVCGRVGGARLEPAGRSRDGSRPRRRGAR